MALCACMHVCLCMCVCGGVSVDVWLDVGGYSNKDNYSCHLNFPTAVVGFIKIAITGAQSLQLQIWAHNNLNIILTLS